MAFEKLKNFIAPVDEDDDEEDEEEEEEVKVPVQQQPVT